MFQGVGNIVRNFQKYTHKTISIPVTFSTPIDDDDWDQIKAAIFRRLSSSPVKVAVQGVGTSGIEFQIIFTPGTE